MGNLLELDKIRTQRKLDRLEYLKDKNLRQKELFYAESRKRQEQAVEFIDSLKSMPKDEVEVSQLYNVINGYKVDNTYLSNLNFFAYLLGIMHTKISSRLREIDTISANTKVVSGSGTS